jgi:DNA modification methylase
MGRGVVIDPFMGSGSTVAAALAVGYEGIGIEMDEAFYALAEKAVVPLSELYPQMRGETLDYVEANGSAKEYHEQLMLMEPSGKYSV